MALCGKACNSAAEMASMPLALVGLSVFKAVNHWVRSNSFTWMAFVGRYCSSCCSCSIGTSVSGICQYCFQCAVRSAMILCGAHWKVSCWTVTSSGHSRCSERWQVTSYGVIVLGRHGVESILIGLNKWKLLPLSTYKVMSSSWTRMAVVSKVVRMVWISALGWFFMRSKAKWDPCSLASVFRWNSSFLSQFWRST